MWLVLWLIGGCGGRVCTDACDRLYAEAPDGAAEDEYCEIGPRGETEPSSAERWDQCMEQCVEIWDITEEPEGVYDYELGVVDAVANGGRGSFMNRDEIRLWAECLDTHTCGEIEGERQCPPLW